MENQGMQEEQANVFVKKEWISPEMEEINVNTGAGYGPEVSFAMS